jgi:hypothetical protein
MTIKEWKENFMELHEAMKKDLEAKTLEIYIEEETLDSYPCLNPISRTNIKIVAK